MRILQYAGSSVPDTISSTRWSERPTLMLRRERGRDLGASWLQLLFAAAGDIGRGYMVRSYRLIVRAAGVASRLFVDFAENGGLLTA